MQDVKDAVDMTLHFLENKDKNGLYNVGTGKARTWVDLVKAIFKSMETEPNIEFIEMPEELKGKYQYFTEAKINKIKKAGYKNKITSLEESVDDYVKEYLVKGKLLGS